MMDRLLALKKPITEYFREQPHNSRKLTQTEWTITNQVCSLLSDVSEITIRMQGAKDTHISQAMFIIHEVMEMLREDSQPIRAQNATEPEEMQVLELSPAEQGVLRGAAGRDGREAGGEGCAAGGAAVRVDGPKAEVA
ncbi:unnamed protein product [Ectocarpus sp. 12 AP-2014]